MTSVEDQSILISNITLDQCWSRLKFQNEKIKLKFFQAVKNIAYDDDNNYFQKRMFQGM
jgi:hypothetical protein